MWLNGTNQSILPAIGMPSLLVDIFSDQMPRALSSVTVIFATAYKMSKATSRERNVYFTALGSEWLG